MGLPELACRGRQAALKRLDRITTFRRPVPLSGRLLEELREPGLDGAAETLLARLRATCSDRFFAGVVSTETPRLITERMPAARDGAIAAAEAVSQGRFDLLGYRGLFFGDPVDWHLDPISGRRAPAKHWSRLDPVDADRVGDTKLVWELNRHQWMVRLGQAYRLTEDERYAAAFARYIRAWMRANPPGIGINWASSLEVSVRLIAWCWALFLFLESDALSPELFLDMLGGICAHASHTERYLSYYFSSNTHLTGEALGLFYAGVVFPELRAASRWRSLGARILVDQSERQVLSDGVYFEQATCYQRYTLEIYLHFLILAARNGLTVPIAVEERVQRMLDFLLALRSPDGSMPRIGDADGGWLLPLATRDPDDLCGVLSTAAALFRRSDCAWAAGGPASDTLWLLGPAAADAAATPPPAPPGTPGSRVFAEGGYTVMRSGWESDAHHLIFDVGPLGCPVSGGHGHADLLSIQCSVFGEPYLVDPGTYAYTAEADWRDFFRGTTAHSTVTVDRTGQAMPAGPFAWKTQPRARLRHWLSTDALDLADADHDGYCRLPDPVIHRRRVLFVKPRYWVITDDLVGTEEHEVQLQFQFAPRKVTVLPTLWAVAHGDGGQGLFVRSFATVPLKVDVFEGESTPMLGWLSPDYGRRRPAPVLLYSAVTRLPLRIVTLLYPTRNPLADPPVVSPVVGEGRGPVELVFEESGEWVRFDDHSVVVGPR